MQEHGTTRREDVPIDEAPQFSGAKSALPPLRRYLHLMRLLGTSSGPSYFRGPGCLGALRFWFKKTVRCLLAWYTRPLHQFHLAATRMAEEQVKALEALEARIRRLEERIAGRELVAGDAGRDFGAALSPPLPFGVNVIGYLTSEKGVGEAVRCNLRTLKAGGVPYVANSYVETWSKNVEQLPGDFSTGSPYGINLINVNADELPRVVEHHPEYCRGQYNIGYWNWELSAFPPEWCGSFGYLDEVWTPSTFVQQSVESVAPVPVACIPLSIDPDIQYAPGDIRRRLGIPEGVFLFLFFFDFHSRLERKNPEGLIRAFRQAFGGRKDAMLLIKSAHGRFHQGDLLRLRSAGRGANIRILDGVWPRARMNALLASANAYVSLHRSEGFGLTLSEAMACGKPVIATGYSGNMDFMTPDNSFLLRFKMVEIEKDHYMYKKGNFWADPDADHAVELMLRVAEDRKLAAEVARRGQSDVMSMLHPSTVAKAVKQRLALIEKVLPGHGHRGMNE